MRAKEEMLTYIYLTYIAFENEVQLVRDCLPGKQTDKPTKHGVQDVFCH